MLSKTQVMSRIVFQEGTWEKAAAATPVANIWLLGVPLLGMEEFSAQPLGITKGWLSSSVTLPCVQGAASAIICYSRFSVKLIRREYEETIRKSQTLLDSRLNALIKHGSCHEARK
jgi:hypothetical protein